MTKLKPCPCGSIPEELFVQATGSSKYLQCSTDCCGSWSVEFKAVGYCLPESEQAMELAIKAWNQNIRGSTFQTIFELQEENKRLKDKIHGK